MAATVESWTNRIGSKDAERQDIADHHHVAASLGAALRARQQPIGDVAAQRVAQPLRRRTLPRRTRAEFFKFMW